MIRISRTICCIVSILAVWVSLSSAFFEDMVPGARPRAMGGAYTAVADDGYATFYNPAGLSQSGELSLGGEYHQPFGLSYLTYSHFWVRKSLARLGAVGISLQDRNTSVGGTSLDREDVFAVSHGFDVVNDSESSLSFGYTVNLYYLSFAETDRGVDSGSAWSAGIDLGLFATLHERSRIGVIAKNVNRPRFGSPESFPLPQWIAAGISYMPFPQVVTSLDVKKEIDRDLSVHGGMEFELHEYLLLRAGIETNPTRFSGGMGFCFSGICIDYAYAAHAVLPETHYFGFSFFPERVLSRIM